MRHATPLDALRYHVTGAIERGEKVAITEQPAPPTLWQALDLATDTLVGPATDYCAVRDWCGPREEAGQRFDYVPVAATGARIYFPPGQGFNWYD